MDTSAPLTVREDTEEVPLQLSRSGKICKYCRHPGVTPVNVTVQGHGTLMDALHQHHRVVKVVRVPAGETDTLGVGDTVRVTLGVGDTVGVTLVLGDTEGDTVALGDGDRLTALGLGLGVAVMVASQNWLRYTCAFNSLL